jgi:hypothetical protein
MSLATLWLPILVSAVLVFIASSLVHMVFKWHNADYRKLPNEDAVREVVRAGAPAPGLYVIPHCADMKEMNTPEVRQKFVDGPVAFLTLRPSGPPTIGGALGLWFAFTVLVSAVAACVAAALPADGCRMCIGGIVAFMTYAGGPIMAGIWMGKPWGSVAKELLDAAIYAALTGATIAFFSAR